MIVKTAELNTQVTFYEYTPNSGPEPGEKEKQILYNAWAKINNVWMKDVELAKANGTLSDITIIIRDPQSEYVPTNKHYISIDTHEYTDKRYNVKQVMPDLQNRQFTTIVAGLIE